MKYSGEKLIKTLDIDKYEKKKQAIRKPYPETILGYRLSREPLDPRERGMVIKYNWGSYGFRSEEEAVEDAQQRISQIDRDHSREWYVELYSCPAKEFSTATKEYKVIVVPQQIDPYSVKDLKKPTMTVQASPVIPQKDGRCVKCGDKATGKSRKDAVSSYCLGGYTIRPDLCPNCNAVGSIVQRLKEGGDISLSELKKLPRILMFNPTGQDMAEEEYGAQFQKIVDNALMQERGSNGTIL